MPSHLLFYVVNMCQKAYNFIDAFICYKQKCKLASFNLGHPVRVSYITRSLAEQAF